MGIKLFDEKAFKLGLSFLTEAPWATDFVNQISLLYKMCDDENQIDLITDMIKSFSFYDLDRYSNDINKLIENAIVDFELSPSNTLVLGMAYDLEKADSSMEVVNIAKVRFGLKGWNSDNIKPKCTLKEKYLNNIKKILVLDEFSGTGSTVENRLVHMKRQIAGFRRDDISICFGIVTCMESAFSKLHSSGIPLCCINKLKRGITDQYVDSELENNKRRMLSLENKINYVPPGKEFHSFGAGDAESLYCIKHRNIPNSVFPIFWWQYYSDGSSRETLFSRFD